MNNLYDQEYKSNIYIVRNNKNPMKHERFNL